MHLLEDDKLAPFRTEYLEREKEIQRYIGVYLSGVVIVFGWIIGPQSKPLNEMALGNNGYNIFAFLIISVVNALFITFLIYKSLDVHDTTQFITVLAQPNSVYRFWENWRRSKHSVTKPVRTGYFIALAFLPAIMALLLLAFSASKIFASDESLRSQLVEIENRRPVNEASIPFTDAQANLPAPNATDVSAQFVRVRSVFNYGIVAFFLVVGLHFVPGWFFYYNAGPTTREWKTIMEFKKAQAKDVSPSSAEALALEEFMKDSLPEE
ncbi:MAG TPA: hypothetical protein VNO50_12310 [Pyrinomonadaceae bacterium]|nr:hypothetical protein [Pyrinomonadaceae bacterium]